MNKKKILVLLLIAILIGGIWIVKNVDLNRATTLTENTGKIEDNTKNQDFELHVTENLDLEALKAYELPIIIDFGADSCIPCKEMAPVLEKLNEALRGKVIVKFVDVWKYQELAQNFPIEVIPTQFFFDAQGNPYVPSEDNAANFQMYSLKETNEHIYTAHQGGMTEEQIRGILKEMGIDD